MSFQGASTLITLLPIVAKASKIVEIITLIFGVPSNVITILVMLRPNMRTSSTAIYFTCTAIADIIALLSGIPSDLLGYSRHGFANSYNQWTCKLSLFCLRASSGTSLWLLTACTVDRFIAICYPFKAKTLLSVKKAIITSVVVTVVTAGHNSYLMWTRGNQVISGVNGTTQMINCGFTSESAAYYTNILEGWPLITVVSYIPLLVIFCLNIKIIVGFHKMKRFQVQSANTAQQAKRKQMLSMTVMLIAASLCLIVLVSPNMTSLAVMTSIYDFTNPVHVIQFQFVRSITIPLMYINNGCNFYIYMLVGTKFRSELCAIFCCRK